MAHTVQRRDEQREFWEENTDSYELFLKLFGGPFAGVRELLRDRVGGSDEVLEVAAGTGRLTTAYASEVGRAVATDYAEAMVSVLQERIEVSGAQCERADIYELPYESDRFDVVVAGNVLHLLDDLEAAVDELLRVLRPGGTLVTPTFVHDETWLGWAVSRALELADGPETRHFDMQTLHRTLEDEGLEVRHAETVSGVMPMAYIESVSAGPVS